MLDSFKTLLTGLVLRMLSWMSRDRLAILIFHRVLPQRDPLIPALETEAEVRNQMQALARWFKVLPLPRAIDLLEQGKLPSRAVCVTFDDGYEDNASAALPILSELGLPATFFIATEARSASSAACSRRLHTSAERESVSSSPYGGSVRCTSAAVTTRCTTRSG